MYLLTVKQTDEENSVIIGDYSLASNQSKNQNILHDFQKLRCHSNGSLHNKIKLSI